MALCFWYTQTTACTMQTDRRRITSLRGWTFNNRSVTRSPLPPSSLISHFSHSILNQGPFLFWILTRGRWSPCIPYQGFRCASPLATNISPLCGRISGDSTSWSKSGIIHLHISKFSNFPIFFTSYKHPPNLDRGVLHFHIFKFSNFHIHRPTHHSSLITQKVLRWRLWYRALPLHSRSARSPW